MKKSFPLIISALLILAACGCASLTRNLLTPVYSPPVGTNAPALVGYAVNTNSATAQTVATVAAVAPLVPPPFGTIAGGLATLAGVSLAAFARLRTIKANQLLNVVIAGVEAAGDAGTKAKIATTALAHGVAGELDAKVNP